MERHLPGHLHRRRAAVASLRVLSVQATWDVDEPIQKVLQVSRDAGPPGDEQVNDNPFLVHQIDSHE